MGTDLLGRDVLSRYLHGGRQAFMTAVTATVITMVTGTALGLVSVAGPKGTDTLLMTVINALLAIPGIVLALVVLAAVGRGTLPLSLSIGLSLIAPTVVVIRAAILSVSSQTYVEAAHALGASRLRVLTLHILPNISPTLAAYTGIVFGYALLNGAALTFLGVGHVPGTPDWGVMLAEGRAVFRTAPWIGIAPGLTIAALVWAANELGDRLAHQQFSF